MKLIRSLFKRPAIYLLLIALVIVVLTRIYYRVTDDFRVSNISYEIAYNPEWEILPTPSEKSEIDHILSQKFTYIGKGAQSYAFGSADQKYVLKFFKFKHLKPSLFLSLLPSVPPFKEFKDQRTARKQKKLDGVFAGYRLAYEFHKNDSGVIFIHLNKTSGLYKPVTLIDKIGLERQVDLDQVVFILQEKARTLRAVMIDLLNQDKIDLVKYRLNQILDLYLSEYQKGIYDRDHGVMHNTGFVGEKPIHLDVGKLTKDSRMKNPEFWQKDLDIIVRKIDTWIKINYPKSYPELAKYMEHKLSLLFERDYSFQNPPMS